MNVDEKLIEACMKGDLSNAKKWERIFICGM